MDFIQLAADRYSVRNFTKEPVKKEDIDRILKAGHLAPTACNRQPQRIIVCSDKETLALMRKCTPCHFKAPVALIVCYDKKRCWKRSNDGKTSGDIDAAIVVTHMMLEAADIGVGTTWVMYFDPEAVRAEFNLPDNIEPVAILVMGYPADDAKPSLEHAEFRPLDEIVSYSKL
jgi:nitroreductase